MNVGMINLASGAEYIGRWSRTRPHGDHAKITAVEPERVAIAQGPQPTEVDSDTASVDPQASPQPTERGAGVLRLLEAGHFRGVAGIRLRINFHDELAARTMERTRPIMERESAALIESVSARVAELSAGAVTDDEGAAMIDALTARFADDVRAAVDEAGQGSTLDAESMSVALRSAFEAMVAEVSAFLDDLGTEVRPGAEEDVAGPDPKSSVLTAVQAVPVTELQPKEIAVTDTPVSVVPLNAEEPVLRPVAERADTSGDLPSISAEDADPMPTPETPTAQEVITALTAAFDEALHSLLAAIEDASRIPEAAPPKGNGVAFEKFVSLYEALYGTGRNVDEKS